ncbi:methylenetetrahydrofolate/ methylenetetrahydromethanopterin dehydrogenase (NADP+) [Methylomarinovum tepidoasis]|uniref:Methylenetetrahydrofolate/ methylenetetrahydromethanopterin dehydrogenase (NADP+) n=1 Tax=Methylomarinovum tepidoasis TaxID=2840183 RepID=A0AAU9CAF1_9GAMM|nr:NADP-dependent methylenetetrahydromethanopterin/methylenetetrahydrofolate dehydrogenase [Methylomarinovum sp. IN45]BCX88886.1 methylenetetrahydrofolate/ methylenetetrahydromethanopterin dehydrogenase (NADP+) [Methylomarinovum sp. IN45]
MKKLLFQFDTDSHPASFDTVVAYDGGADHVIGHANLTPDNVGPLVDGTIFTRAPKDKKNTAIFIGGSDLQAGEALLAAVTARFFANFRVSVMLDSNGSNTTAAAGVARIVASTEVRGKKAVVLAGTGPVGQRAAALLAKEGAQVVLTSRSLARARAACEAMRRRFGVEITPVEAIDAAARAAVIEDAQIVFATGAAGVRLLEEFQWRDLSRLEVLVDANATPPLGIEGVDMMDRGTERHGKICWGAIGFGALKLAVHRACIAKLFERNDLVLDAEEIYAIAREMVHT